MTADVLALGARAVGRDLTLVRPLTGGAHASTLLVRDDAGTLLVVRRFPPGGAVTRERAILPLLTGLGVGVPRLVGHLADEAGEVLVTLALPGVPPGPPWSPEQRLPAVARTLAAIHRGPVDRLAAREPRPITADTPVAIAARAVWPRLQAEPAVFSHGDYWTGNILFDAGEVTGVVDWNGARPAPAGFDLAWCRQDLVLLGETDSADLLVSEYVRAGGRAPEDLHAWDVFQAAHADPVVEEWTVNYAGIGRTEVDAEVLRHRLDGWIAHLLG